MTLEAGSYTVEWYSVGRREAAGAGRATVASRAAIGFSAPFAAPGPAVLYLKRAGR